MCQNLIVKKDMLNLYKLFKLFFVVSIIALYLSSCSYFNNNPNEDKTYLSDLVYYEKKGIKIFYKGNEIFTGTAWASDGRTLSINCENGTLIGATLYNPNGSRGVYVDFSPSQYVWNNSVDMSFYLFNNDGAPLIKVARNTKPPLNAKFLYQKIDTTSASYGKCDYWYSDKFSYPYENHQNMIERGELILDKELKKIN